MTLAPSLPAYVRDIVSGDQEKTTELQVAKMMTTMIGIPSKIMMITMITVLDTEELVLTREIILSLQIRAMQHASVAATLRDAHLVWKAADDGQLQLQVMKKWSSILILRSIPTQNNHSLVFERQMIVHVPLRFY
jgi:hypothetical protein